MKAFLGIFWLCVLFAACFFFVHIGLTILQKQNEQPTKNEPPPPPKREPKEIYYIVEKKSRRKNSYSPPKRINFD